MRAVLLKGPSQYDGTRTFIDHAARALEARGDGFDVTASYGVVRLPADADTPEEALHLADRRMYAAKEARPWPLTTSPSAPDSRVSSASPAGWP